ncbi:MAG: 3-hydroxyacyl-CoA dehydrogenase NAD-binding domain-containing protein, partial [Granulosicoccaceae bacterium]
IHAFFTDRQVSKIPEAKSGSPRPINKIAVIGGGTMGAGIATACLLAGIPVITVEREQTAVDAGRERIDTALAGAVKRGKMSQEHKDNLINNNWAGSTEYAAISDVDLVIEAVFEDMDVKKAVFSELERHCKPGAVLATNTSYLNIDEIAASTKRPEDIIGLHFFSPAHVMKLLEVVVADKCANDVVATAFALAKKLKKVAVRAGVCDGFIGNRILGSYLKSAYYMVEDGVSPYQLDRAIKTFGYPMGPFEMGDLAGLDIGWANRKRKATKQDPRERQVRFIDQVCEEGWFGQKTGKGFYQYEKGVRGGTERPEVLELIANSRADAGIKPREFSDEEITTRYLAALINEAAKVVEEGIALRPLDVDQTSLYGYGFPRWRGGPLKYADMIGLEKVLENIEAFAREDAYFWQPAPLLKKLVAEGKTFDSLNKI